MSNKTDMLSLSSKSSPTANTKANRLPAPTLFVGPPSRNASQLSITGTVTNDGTTKQTRDPLHRQKSALSRPVHIDSDSSPKDTAPTTRPAHPLRKASERTIEAKWKEMQSTLHDVELTAQSSTHVFGESHAAALDELRIAQVELARAWGRGNEQRHAGGDIAEMNVNRFKGADELALDRQNVHGRKRGDTAESVASASTALSGESGRSEGTGRSSGRGGGSLEDETAQDIKLASERRAANEAYFKQVDGGVKDVVAKLEVVAQAMRGVEGESRSLWSSSSSGAGSSLRESRDGESRRQGSKSGTSRS